MFRLFRLARTFTLLIVIAALAAAAACAIGAGRMLVDPRATNMPAPADVIFVLSGSVADRWLEAYDLWMDKRAPLILLNRGLTDAAARELQRRGVHVPDGAEIARDVMVRQLGMPPEAVEILDGTFDNTAAEAEALRRIAAARGWRSAIVVTSLPHTRRTSLAMRRALDGAGMTVQVRASRYGTFEPWGWWRSRGSTRWVASELPKLAAYWLGLGG